MKNKGGSKFVVALVIAAGIFSTQVRAESCPFNGDGARVYDSWSNANGDSTYDILVQSDDKIVVAGFADWGGPVCPGDFACMAIARYDAQGCRDTSFGNGGVFAPALGSRAEIGHGLAQQDDGKFVEVGIINRLSKNAYYTDSLVSRITSSGALDTSFAGNGYTSLRVSGLNSDLEVVVIQKLGANAGKIVGAGYVTNTSLPSFTNEDSFIARFKSNGSLDTGSSGFGGGSKAKGYYIKNAAANSADRINAIALQNDDKIVTSGYATDPLGSIHMVVMRFTANGTLDSSFASGGVLIPNLGGSSVKTQGTGVVIQPDGKIIITGSSNESGVGRNFMAARFLSDGSLDTSFNAPSGYALIDADPTLLSEFAYRSLLQPDGKIVMAGGVGDNAAVVRLNSDGTRDATFGTDGVKIQAESGSQIWNTALALLSNGDIVANGQRWWSGSNTVPPQPFLMRLWP